MFTQSTPKYLPDKMYAVTPTPQWAQLKIGRLSWSGPGLNKAITGCKEQKYS